MIGKSGVKGLSVLLPDIVSGEGIPHIGIISNMKKLFLITTTVSSHHSNCARLTMSTHVLAQTHTSGFSEKVRIEEI